MSKAQRTRELSAPALLPACVRKTPPVHNLQIWRPPEALVHLQNWPLKVGLFQMLKKSSTASTTSWSTIRKGHYMHKQVHWSRIIMRSNNKSYFQVSTWHLHHQISTPGISELVADTGRRWLDSCQIIVSSPHHKVLSYLRSRSDKAFQCLNWITMALCVVRNAILCKHLFPAAVIHCKIF